MHLLRLLLLLFWLSGCSAALSPITGPATVSGPERGSLSLLCRYASGWKAYNKYWCRGSNWRKCQVLVMTTGSEQEVKKDRISIRDDQKNFRFTVTMEDLRRDDADIYWCGIEKVATDHMIQVSVTIGPAPTTEMTTVPTTCTANTFTEPATVEDTNGLPTLTSHYSDGSPSIMELSILLPIIFAVLLLLFLGSSLLAWRMVRQQKKAAELSPEQVLQPLESDICYAHLDLQQPRTSQKKASAQLSSAQAGQAEVEYVTMAPFPREEVSYASLSLDQEPTYGNTGHIASRGHEEPTEYSSIRRP